MSLAGAVLLGAATAVQAQQRLQEVEGLPFSLEIDRRMEAGLLPLESAVSFGAARIMPASIGAIDVLEVTWPKSGRKLNLSIGRTAQPNAPQVQQYTVIAVAVDGSEATLAGTTRTPLAGTMNRICIWAANGPDGDLIVLFSLAAGGMSDSQVYAFRVTPGGLATDIPTGGALTSYGGFDVVDLDEDGSFELITSRNLDGMAGGFSYHAVRHLSGDAYQADPERFKTTFYQDELRFLDWVIATREMIQADPEPYLDKALFGFYYAAEYEGQLYGFDSLVELPPNARVNGDLWKFNKLRADAFKRVLTYRDELRAWAAGGERPATWKLSK